MTHDYKEGPYSTGTLIERLEQTADRIEQLSNALSKYSCKCTEPCALYKAEKEREGDMPHMMCGWWSVAALNGDK